MSLTFEGDRLPDGAMDDVLLTQIKELAQRQSEGLSGHLLAVCWLKSQYPACYGFVLLVTSSPQRQRTKTETVLLILMLSQGTDMTEDMDSQREVSKAILQVQTATKESHVCASDYCEVCCGRENAGLSHDTVLTTEGS